MAQNAETLGEFKIEVAVAGGVKVKSDLESMRKGLHKLKEELTGIKAKGGDLVSVLQALKGFNLKNITGGGAGATANNASVFKSIAKDAKSATSALSKFAEAIRAAKGDTASLDKSYAKATALISNKVIGGIQKDAAGHVTGRTGLMGVSYSLGALNRQLGGGATGVTKLNRAFTALIGETRKDPVTGEVTRTGSKFLLTSFNTLSRAAAKAAKNLEKIKAGGGAGGNGAPPAPPSGTTWTDRMLKQMKGSEKTLGGIGQMLTRANIGNTQMLSTLASGFGTLGRLAGFFMSGPVGIALGALGLGTSIVKTSEGMAARGKSVNRNIYSYRNSLASQLLDADKIDKEAMRNRLAYTVYDDHGNYDALATDRAAHQATASLNADFETSKALFETRGIEAPWMTALANQGIDYTAVGSREELKELLSKRYQELDKNNKWDVAQWKTLMYEMGGALTDEDKAAITFEGYKNKKTGEEYENGITGYEKASRAMGEKSAFDEGTVGTSERMIVTERTMASQPLKADVAITEEKLNILQMTSGLEKAVSNVTSIFDVFGKNLKEIFTVISGSDPELAMALGFKADEWKAPGDDLGTPNEMIEKLKGAALPTTRYDPSTPITQGNTNYLLIRGDDRKYRTPWRLENIDRATQAIESKPNLPKPKYGPLANQVTTPIEINIYTNNGEVDQEAFKLFLTDAVSNFFQQSEIR